MCSTEQKECALRYSYAIKKLLEILPETRSSDNILMSIFLNVLWNLYMHYILLRCKARKAIQSDFHCAKLHQNNFLHRTLQNHTPHVRTSLLVTSWLFSLRHSSHFLLSHFGHWNIPVICVTLVLKLTLKVSFSLYFQTFWPKWLTFFQSFQSHFSLWSKNNWNENRSQPTESKTSL